jgi:hypothetical protein
MKRRQTPEGALLQLVMQWLAAERIYAIRMNTGTLRDATGRPVFFGVPGMADILAFPHVHTGERNFRGTAEVTYPEPVWIELKAGSKQSLLQKSFQEQVEGEGHRYFLIYSLDELIESLK